MGEVHQGFVYAASAMGVSWELFLGLTLEWKDLI